MLSLALFLARAVDALAIDTPSLSAAVRQRTSLNSGWRFFRTENNTDNIVYQNRAYLENRLNVEILKPWILPSGNDFIKDAADRHQRPSKEPATKLPYINTDFDDGDWEDVTLPHDWAIKGPYDQSVDGGMGHLPSHGVGWYRRTFELTAQDVQDRQIYLEVGGAMSYAMVWVNGKIVGGWPYGYNSFQLDLTDYVDEGKDNQLAIRVDNPRESSRWYPGGGIYRDIWLNKVSRTHVGQWGTFITTKKVSNQSAILDLSVEVQNNLDVKTKVNVSTSVYYLDGSRIRDKVAEFPSRWIEVGAGKKDSLIVSAKVASPKLWGPPPAQKPNLYVAVTKLYSAKGEELDSYETEFGIRTVDFTEDNGLVVNSERVQIQGVNQHHDLGALGAAFNVRAAERQLEVLRSFGVNAIRMSHNPPATELLQLTDRMGFLVMDEVFDVWAEKKVDYDFHVIFDDWSEADLRSMLRRDRNHASVIVWSFGNEIQEQDDGEDGAAIGYRLRDIVRQEDKTRPTTSSMNWAQPHNVGAPFIDTVDVISLNYQGGGIRYGPNYQGLKGTRTPPMYLEFHESYPEKSILSTESTATVSSRGIYLFPVVDDWGAPVNDSSGGDETLAQVSAYELYTADFSVSAERVFESLDRNPYAAGEFVWTGWDYLGEPTPYDESRSSYFGIVDLAGFRKDRYYLYQARWRPDHPMAHILPHWNWPDRKGKVTPVHVFTSGDSAELFLNGKSLGKKQRGQYEYRLRWDEVEYTPGKLHVIAYKNGKKWAEDSVQTTGKAESLRLTADRDEIKADGYDLSFVTVEVVDGEGNVVPEAADTLNFSIEGDAAEIAATDNGDQHDFVPFQSTERKAFSGSALVIVRSKAGEKGEVKITAKADGLESAVVTVKTE
ncbi:beta-galactosidase [Geosmithia morbida]|uniref:Beta-galactosidase n=1 Tax=Geosmithia morbida TaxID=1094350 RepID=A0A9P4Z219_9HYPO|nr:beta-galactosidase [Geosmithia morbida]KAF4125994.1 beta-galactosidase [Geosmithia morbida]